MNVVSFADIRIDDLIEEHVDERIDEVESLEIRLETDGIFKPKEDPLEEHDEESVGTAAESAAESVASDSSENRKKMSLYRNAGQINVTAKPALFQHEFRLSASGSQTSIGSDTHSDFSDKNKSRQIEKPELDMAKSNLDNTVSGFGETVSEAYQLGIKTNKVMEAVENIEELKQKTKISKDIVHEELDSTDQETSTRHHSESISEKSNDLSAKCETNKPIETFQLIEPKLDYEVFSDEDICQIEMENSEAKNEEMTDENKEITNENKKNKKKKKPKKKKTKIRK